MNARLRERFLIALACVAAVASGAIFMLAQRNSAAENEREAINRYRLVQDLALQAVALERQVGNTESTGTRRGTEDLLAMVEHSLRAARVSAEVGQMSSTPVASETNGVERRLSRVTLERIRPDELARVLVELVQATDGWNIVAIDLVHTDRRDRADDPYRPLEPLYRAVLDLEFISVVEKG
ncbi:MAG: hypothetical protein AAGI30_09395 [Planctomycetota bacterium]